MNIIAAILIGLVAFEHLYFLWLEMFVWETKGKKAFKESLAPEMFASTKVLAANQGLYNGFLAAGLFWTFFIDDHEWKINIAVFFLVCITIAGIYGAITASKKIFFIQALPSIAALLFIFLDNWI